MSALIRKSVLALVALIAVAGGTQTASAVESLSELLEQTRNARAAKTAENAEREREFIENRDRRAGLLADAKRKRDAAEARSKALSTSFDANEIALAELEDRMDQRVGNLGELFGVVRQVAGDGASIVYNSLLSAQYAGRDTFFSQLGQAKELPSIEKLERLWFEIQREMTESGRVVRFDAKVIDADGEPRDAEVVRIGSFIAMSDGKYLSYLPSVGKLGVLPRQPSGELLHFASALQQAKSGHVKAAVDPSRGVLLSMIVQRPDIVERIEKGEAVGYVIIVVGLIGMGLAFYQTIYLVWTRAAVSRQLKSLDRLSTDNPLGRVLAAVKTDPETIEADAEVVELRVSEAVLREVPRLERFQPFLRLAVAAGPLLGLVGTVIGMIITFQSITESGSSDPRLMANGIGQAMIATVLGLGIAVPLLFLNAGLATLSRGVVQILDQQSTGLLAEILERDREAR
ncbi:MAG: MotA/TolQ/ExbB proton channel family protein [Deltaproteobacteria bacterium]|nr:MotA/TolQ/ExbB proton channel family protein [Deltaproteobacteria bacterium]